MKDEKRAVQGQQPFSAVGFLSLFLVPSALTANAMSDVWYAPTCEANFGESTTATLSSKTTVVSYKFPPYER